MRITFFNLFFCLAAISLTGCTEKDKKAAEAKAAKKAAAPGSTKTAVAADPSKSAATGGHIAPDAGAAAAGGAATPVSADDAKDE
jgi:hypothetical protein